MTFLDTTDYLRLRALTFTDSADTETMERLVERVFPDEVFERGPEEKGEGGGGGGYGYFCLHVEKVPALPAYPPAHPTRPARRPTRQPRL